MGYQSRLDCCLDWAERLAVLALYGWLVARILQSIAQSGNYYDLLLLVSEGLVVAFMLLRRRPAALSRNWFEWLISFAVTGSSMLAAPGGEALVPVLTAAVILLVGIFMQLYGKLTLGRSIGCVPAHRGLTRKGPYHFLRHPIYAGYMCSHVGFLLMNPTLRNLALYVVATALQIPRLLAEERLLSQDPAYRAYLADVPDRLLPGDRWLWRRFGL
jgi:protein-S-isoprenylcysteine O-methyltransferase Ste14